MQLEAAERTESLRGDYDERDWIGTLGSVPENLSSDRIPPLFSVKADSENVRCTESAMWVDRAAPLGVNDLLLKSAVSTDPR